MLATPPKRTTEEDEEAEEEEAEEEEEKPTKIDVANAMQSSQEQPPTEETHPGKTEDESYLPKPDASQSPNFGTSSEKDQEEDDIEKKPRRTSLRNRNRNRSRKDRWGR